MSEYCRCSKITGVYTDYMDDWGYWEVCDKCNKKLEDGYHYYNHYDGKDHDDCNIY